MKSFKDMYIEKTSMEKPGESTHTAKWDRCVEHVKASGSGKNAYAVCTAMLGDEAFKTTESEVEEKSNIDEYMRKLGISGAGPIPQSLLANQDLEFNSSTNKHMEFTLHKSKKDIVKAAFEGTEMEALIVCETFMGSDIYISPEMKDSDGHAIGCYFVVGQDMGWQGFMTVEAAREFIASVFKGAVETTGKELIDMSMEAKHADVPTDSIVENIKAIQIKRQKATIAAREKEQGATTKSFKEAWNPISREWDAK